ncbi:caspase family protein [Micromonospora sp. NBC_01392]|uniref:caspase, EACC1-associated type n=1 Tax=Micromonospora sp. NBC_01392 TaxID=2903588 RepID=UPI003244B686
MGDLAGRGVRVLVIGTATHHGDGLPSVPAARSTAEALAESLAACCDVPAGQLTLVTDPPDVLTIARAVSKAAQEAESALLIWYVGHGLRGPGGELHLAASSTDRLVPGLAAHQAYALADLREALSTCRAPSVVVVLDCCYSGRARLTAPPPDPLGELSPVHGVYLLSSAEQLASAAPGRQHTAFTGEFLRFLDEGDPEAGPMLTLDDSYHHLFRVLRARGGPLPRRHDAGNAGRLALADNPARRPGPVTVDESEPPSPGPSPWRSLQPYREEDERNFFGRDEISARLVRQAGRRLADPAPMLVLGPSGSGKTSLLHAGMIATIRRDGLPVVGGGRVWPALRPVVTPGRDPLAALFRVVGALPDEPPESVAELLDRLAPEQPSLVVVDQVEELFTLGADRAARAAFLDGLAALAGPRPDGTPRAVVVAALRADFYGPASEEPAFGRLLAGPRVVVGPMSGTELRQTIEGPAGRAGLELGDGLAELLLHELGAGSQRGPEPGALPLLSHVLFETWRRRVGNRLSVSGYRGSGGLTGAVAKTAEETYEGLDDAARATARRLLLQLVRVGADGIDAARPLPRAELLTEDAAAEVVLERLAAHRLVGIDPSGVVRISHEILLTAWPRLRTWINEDRGRLAARQQIVDSTAAWVAGGRDRGDLLSGVRLTVARRALPDGEVARLGGMEREFLRRSLHLQRLRRGGAALLAVLVLLAGAGAVVAGQQRARAQRLDDQIASRRLAAQANAMRSNRPEDAFSLSLAAYRTAPTAEARQALFAAYADPRPQPVAGHDKPVFNLAYTPDGRTLVSSGHDRRIRLWDVTEPRRPVARGVIEREQSTVVAVRPVGHLLAGASADTFGLWDIADPAHPQPVAMLGTRASPTYAAAFAPDGRTLATGGAHGTLRLWDVREPAHPRLSVERAIGASQLQGVAFSPDGRTLAVAHGIEDGRTEGTLVTIWDVRDPQRPIRRAALPVPSATAVAFSPVGPVLAAGGAGGVMNAWDVTRPERPRPIRADVLGSPATEGAVFSLSFRADGEQFATASTTGGVRLWRIDRSLTGSAESVRQLDSLPGRVPGRSVAFRPDGRGLADGDDEGAIRVWSSAVPVLGGHLDPVVAPVPGNAVGFAGRYALVDSGADERVGARLWDLSVRPPAPLAELPADSPNAVFLPDDRTASSQNRGGAGYRLWDLTDPRHPTPASELRWPGTPGADLTVAASRDERHLALADQHDRTVLVLDISDPRAPVESSRFVADGPVRGLVFLGEGTLSVWGPEDIRLWDVTDPVRPVPAGVLPGAAAGGRLLYQHSRHVAFTATREVGNRALTRLWDLTDPYRPRQGGDIPMDDTLGDVMVTDPETLAVSASGGVQTWDIRDISNPRVGPVVAADSVGRALDISRDGRTLVATNTVTSASFVLWRRTEPGSVFTVFATVPGEFAEFTPDSRAVLANLPVNGRSRILAPGGGAAVWDLDPDRVYRQLCEVPPVQLTDAEWRRYFGALDRRAPCP